MSSSCEEETPLLTSQVSDDDINTERGYNAYTDINIQRRQCLYHCTGAILATGGLLAASFVNDILLLILSYSIVTGLGFSLMYIPSVVSCVTYFNKRQSLAIGVCLCGSGFGTFSLAPIVQVILENWGWRWVM